MLARVILDCRPVVDRRLLTFLVSPRKVSQRRRPRRRCPLKGGSFAASQKMGNARNSLRSNNGHFLIHFLSRSKGIDTSELQTSKATTTPTSTQPMCQIAVDKVNLSLALIISNPPSARRHPKRPFKMPREMTLVRKPCHGRNLGHRQILPQQALCTVQPQLVTPGMWRHTGRAGE